MVKTTNIGVRLTRLSVATALLVWNLGAGASLCASMSMSCCDSRSEKSTCNRSADLQIHVKSDDACCCSKIQTAKSDLAPTVRFEKVDAPKVLSLILYMEPLSQEGYQTEFPFVLKDFIRKFPDYSSHDRIITLQTFLI